MKVPIEWLKEFVQLKLRPEELAERLTMAGVEVGAIEYHGSKAKGVIVGKIKAVERSNDHLICEIDIGSRLIKIITDDLSLAVSDKVPVAIESSKLASGIKIRKLQMHGVESFGMLCRPHELGLQSAEKVLKLPVEAKVGEEVKKFLGRDGVILDLDILPNRGDLQSIIGVSSEVAAVLDTELKLPKTTIKQSKKAVSKKVEVRDKALCPRYMARLITGIKIKESPDWLKDRLQHCGLRPINNAVDITNYVLMEYGQPLHAFDADKVDQIVVRKAQKGEKITTIDGEERQLDPSMLVIADSKKAIAVAGIMGGGETEVSESTQNILLESAYFDSISINRTSQILKLRSESSIRFGKGVDWAGVSNALDRAAALIAELGEGEVAAGKIDIKTRDRKPSKIQLRISRVEKILGKKIGAAEIKKILLRLGFKTSSSSKDRLTVLVPLKRGQDIEKEIDLIEEVARIYGYGKIDKTVPRISQELEYDPIEVLRKRVSEVLVGAGLYEVQTFSVLDPNFPARLNLEEDYLKDYIRVMNPLTEEESVLRTIMIPSLLKVLDHNIRHQIEEVRIFEVGKVYQRGKAEKLKLSGAVYGNGASFLELKGIISVLLDEFGSFKVESINRKFLHPGRSAGIIFNDKAIGYFGELHPDVSNNYGFSKEAFVFEIDMDLLLKASKQVRKFRSLPRFPKTDRDVAMFIKEGTTHQNILQVIKESGGEWVEDIQLFDTYKNSRAYRVTYRDPNRTLTVEEVNARHDEVCKLLSSKLGVELRR